MYKEGGKVRKCERESVIEKVLEKEIDKERGKESEIESTNYPVRLS